MSGILNIKSEDANKLHPEALKWFNDQRAAIECEVALDELTNDDLHAFLSDDEKREFIRRKEEITRGLASCMDIVGAARHGPLGDATIGLTVLRFQVESLSPMHTIESLLKAVYKRKVEKGKEEQKRRQEEARRRQERVEAERRKKEAQRKWRAAHKAVNPPIDDAKRYLNDEEYDGFIKAAREAIQAYLEKGEAYTTDTRIFNYRWCLKKIEDRKEEEAQRLQAARAASEYNHRLNQEIAKLTSQLDHKLKDLSSYFRAEIRDKRYIGYNFDYALSKKDEINFDRTLVSAANKKLEQLFSNDLRYFIDLPSQYYRLYFPLPSASYCFAEVPCIDFSFEIFAAACAEVWLKPRRKSFDDYEFPLPWIEERNDSALLQKPKFLGYYHLILRPEDLDGYTFWQSIPLILLNGLLNGETKPDGTTISAASDESVIYKVQEFEEEVDVPDKFAQYLRSTGSIDEMIGVRIVTEKVAGIVKVELTQLKEEHRALSLEKMIKGKDSKKAKAFQLFSEGKRPSDPKVKNLGIKPSTAYRYYQDWKKTHNHT